MRVGVRGDLTDAPGLGAAPAQMRLKLLVVVVDQVRVVLLVKLKEDAVCKIELKLPPNCYVVIRRRLERV